MGCPHIRQGLNRRQDGAATIMRSLRGGGWTTMRIMESVDEHAAGDEAASEELQASEELHRRGWRKAFTVAEMVDQWARLVAAVQSGYDDDIYEYLNDLYSRNWLHEAWVLLPGHVVETWTPKIRGLDDRFRAATVFDDGQALAQFHRVSRFDPDAMWWWRRHPGILIGDLGRSLASAGAVGLPTDPWLGPHRTPHTRLDREER
jgi:hypothetical protein